MKGSFKKALIAVALTTAGLTAAAPSYAEITANASVTSNYIWRGLTQTTNDAENALVQEMPNVYVNSHKIVKFCTTCSSIFLSCCP